MHHDKLYGMKQEIYRAAPGRSKGRKKNRPVLKYAGLLVLLVIVGLAAYKIFGPSPSEKAADQLQFDSSVTDAEQVVIRQAVQDQSKTYNGTVQVSAATTREISQESTVLTVYVPVTNKYAAKQSITSDELAHKIIYVSGSMDEKTKAGIASAFGMDAANLKALPGTIENIKESEVALIPATELSTGIKLLALDDTYYLDTFKKGAVFRYAVFAGDDAASLADLNVNSLPGKDATLKVTMSGVTALTRLMQKKLTTVNDPKYFSKKIGEFLADADITHVSNEVSFRDGCQYSNTSFCSPPQFIETLKDSGVDLVELTGNHNNDNGNTYNTESINLYHSLGWHTYGGGLNTAEAAKPYVADMKNNKVTFIAYNLADGPGSGAIATSTTAGANLYENAKAESDIKAAKANSQFVVVDIQYSECQAYPTGYVEYPQCDGPIGGQQEAFRQLIDWGADMVIGSSAHQPQTYEVYKGKQIYYGIGNLYFEQTQWPGTERGIILTHYFTSGKLLQTKLTPTVYDAALQTHPMDKTDAESLLDRLGDARPIAGS